MTQFHGDHTPITVTIGATTLIPQVTTAEHYIEEFFPTWDYSQRYIDVGAMLAFIVFFRACTYLALMYVDHKKN